ncbi:MAG: hypothetical protein Q8O99_05290 [bacterium]|nr:hypothetical protein [bacterium]
MSSPFMSDANLASHQDLINRFKSWVTIPSSSAMKTPLVNESGKTNFTVDNILSQTGSAA